ncbi:MAG TPA: sugar phosphate isomerase/epimerase [Chitinophagaceae bacterium]|nr:sugar phosphate isomerase/epimerase [Chitinophagaceae bacterium]
MRTLIIIALILQVSAAISQDIGVQLYSFRNQFKTDIPGTLDAIRKMGITKLEGGDSYGLSHAEFKKMLDDRKMKVISVGGDFNKLQTDLLSIIGNAKIYGAKYVVCFWIPHKGSDFTIDDARKAVEVFNTAGKALKEKGLNLCYHPHGYEFRPYESGTLFDYIVTKTNPQYVNFEMDVFWVKHPGQDPVSLLEKYAGRFQLMHLKDRKPGTTGNQNGEADVESNVVLGQGDVGIGEIMKVAKKFGVKHFFIEDESSRSIQQVPQSLNYLKSLKK